MLNCTSLKCVQQPDTNIYLFRNDFRVELGKQLTYFSTVSQRVVFETQLLVIFT